MVAEKLTAEPSHEYAELEDFLEENFRIIESSVAFNTGLPPTADFHGVTNISPEFRAEGEHARVGHAAVDLIGTIETSEILKLLSPESAIVENMDSFVKRDLLKLLNVFDNPRWTVRFDKNDIIGNKFFTTFADPSIGVPEVHMKTNGDPLEGQRQNQPDAWGEFLLAICRAYETGIISKDDVSQHMLFIERVAGYLQLIQPWNIKSTAMWEDEEAYSPASISSALVMAECLRKVRDNFIKPGSDFEGLIDGTVYSTMRIVRGQLNTDRTAPKYKHPDGADAAMLMRMAYLHDSEETRLPVIQYIEENAERLGIGVFPGIKRYISDSLYKNTDPRVLIGEARHTGPNLALIINYAKIAQIAAREVDLGEAKKYLELATSRLEQTFAVINKYKRLPMAFIPTHPTCVELGDNPWIEPNSKENIVLIPTAESIMRDRALVMWAAAEQALAKKRYEHLEEAMGFA